MSENILRPRNWKQVARELANEQNPSKCWKLSEELNKAIAEEARKGTSLFAKDQIMSGDTASILEVLVATKPDGSKPA